MPTILFCSSLASPNSLPSSFLPSIATLLTGHAMRALGIWSRPTGCLIRCRREMEEQGIKKISGRSWISSKG
ncbi:hypothetical protein GBA52_023875 [Prunus armeniaca]|nr:hypothetical protein GBA52_023875 [Prunus armeniaca]